MNDTSHDTSAAAAAGHEPSHAAGRPSSRQSVYDVVTTRILELLERGTVPWRSGWTRSPVRAPRSASTGKVYRGINHFLLAIAAQTAGYTRSSWITFRQAKELGGSVRMRISGHGDRVDRSMPISRIGACRSRRSVDADHRDRTMPIT